MLMNWNVDVENDNGLMIAQEKDGDWETKCVPCHSLHAQMSDHLGFGKEQTDEKKKVLLSLIQTSQSRHSD